jgi:4-amino-4-deoxy-L-arabinose transferase-like glycosyltransferase
MAGYALLLLLAVLALPLRIEELLQVLVSNQHSLARFIGWIPQAPGSAPLNYFVQFPFISVLGVSRLAARLPSLLFGLGSCYLFLRLAQFIRLRRPYVAVAVFALLPSQYRSATEARPFEQALFLLLLATLFFVRLLRTPNVNWSVRYGLVLTLCIYTERFSYLPSIGYLLFLFAFVNRANERRVIRFALPPTVASALLFVPYYLWARPRVNPKWLFAPSPPGTPSSVYLQFLHNFAGDGVVGYVLSLLLIFGLFAGLWRLFSVAPADWPRSIAVFCLFGGVVITLCIVLAVDVWNGYPFNADQALWAMPGVIVLSFIAIEQWVLPKWTPWVVAAPALLIALCLMSDAEYLVTRTEDLRSEAALIRPQLTDDSCVVFVSEGLSRDLFLLFDPNLKARECRNFFHKRAVLASHAYVRPDQQENAESFFRGLNFTEVKRFGTGGGQILVVENTGR